MAMAEFSYAENIIKCKADQNSPVWKDHVQLAHQVHPKQITRCTPITQIEKAQKEVKRDGDLVKDLSRISNAYYCLLRYAVNLSGDSDKTIYKVIKMYTGYYVYNISSVIADEALSILKDMGYYFNNDYQDELELSTEEDGGIYTPEASQLKSIIFELFLSHLLCQKIAMNIAEAFRELDKYDQAGKELGKSEIARKIIWEIKEGQFTNVENCMNKLENSKLLKQRQDQERQQEIYRQKQSERYLQGHELFEKQQFQKQQQFEQQQFGQQQVLQKKNDAHMQQQQQQRVDNNADDTIDDDDLYGLVPPDNHDQYENPKPIPRPRTDIPSRPNPTLYENPDHHHSKIPGTGLPTGLPSRPNPSLYDNSDHHHSKITKTGLPSRPNPSLYDNVDHNSKVNENIADDDVV